MEKQTEVATDLLEAAKQVINAWSHGDFVSQNKADKENGNQAIGKLAMALQKAKGRE